MQFLKNLKYSWKVLRHPDFLPIVIVLSFGLLASKGLIGKGYFNMHDDLQMMRQLEMEKCFLDLQIPCRWVPDMGYGFGYPLFNFYPPLPYLVGEGIRLIGYSFVDTVKILFIFSIVISGVTMYFLAKEFFDRFGGVVSSIFYIWAPYHAVDVYVRGAMNEAWALIWFPLILFFSYRLIFEKQKTVKWIIGLSLSWFGLFTSHNLMVLIFAPFFAVWCILWLIKSKNIVRIPHLVVSGIWSFALSAFFTMPVLIEKGIVSTNTLVVGYYEYTAHFANISQILFSRFWGYGPSIWTTADGMSFQVGWIHWGFSIVVMALILLKIIKTKKLKFTTLELALIFFFFSGWFAAFMIHSRSTPIWKLFEGQLKFVQFPWRFLTIVTLSFSFIAGSVTKLLPKKLAFPAGSLLILAVLIYSWSYFLPQDGKLGPLTDTEKFSGVAWEMQQTAGIYDYLPETAKTAPKEPRKTLADIIIGRGKINSSSYGTDWAKMNVNMQNSGVLRINIIDFPNWKVFVDGKEVNHFIPDSEDWGRIYINLASGDHEIYAKLFSTWPRTLGNIISLVSWLSLILVVLFLRKKDV